MTTTYKGNPITINEDRNAPADYRYVAYINDIAGGREHTRGYSEDNALDRLKQRIDNITVFNEIHFAPLSEEELLELKSYLLEKATEIVRTIRREHFILPNRFYSLTDSVIYNHHKLIEECLHSAEKDLKLGVASITNKYTKAIEKVALYSLNYYNTQYRLQELKEKLLDS